MNTNPIIKICGIRDPQLAVEAVKMGADYIGIMMHKPSKRYVDMKTAKNIADAVKRANGIPIAVFVDTPAQEIKIICENLAVNVVQLHGAISRKGHRYLPEFIKRIYVVHVDNDGNIHQDINSDLKNLNKQRDLLLFDAIKGGNGKQFPYNNFHTTNFPALLGEAREGLPFLLAGGLTPDNVSSAIATVKPQGVDVSSGVERSPGIKDKTLIKRFITHAKYNTQ